jgi:hypothetical protein
MKVIALSFVLFVAVAFAQNPTPAPNGPQVMVLSGLKSGKTETGGFIYLEMMRGGEFVKGAPYSAMAVTETTQVLLDGNHIVNRSTALLARDREGRSRREEVISNLGPLPTNTSNLAFINDPVAKAEYVLNLDDLTAHVHKPVAVKIITLDQKRAALAEGEKPLQSSASAEVKQQALPSETIEGVYCEHILETQTIPAGSIGNERPIVITSETWASPELHLLVSRKRNDPRFGQTVYKLTGIKRGDPDPSLFQVPGNFKVVNGREVKERSNPSE